MNAEAFARVLRACHDLDGGDTEWQRGLAEAVAPIIGGDVARAFSFHVVNPHARQLELEHFEFQSSKVETDWARWSRAITQLAPKTAYRGYLGPPCVSTSDIYGSSLVLGLARAYGLKGLDVLGVLSRNEVGAALVIAVPQSQQSAYSRDQVRTLTRLSQHIGAAFRLREAIRGLPEDDGIEARFDPAGNCLDAVGIAKERGLRERLREAVLRGRAMGVGGQSSKRSGEPLSWSSLVEGRWSLVDRFDRDGKQFVVAYRNPKGVLDPRMLTKREQEVAQLACRGASNRDIADALGTAPGTVGVQVRSLVTKLGLKSRLELPAFYRVLERRSQPLASNTDLSVATAHLGEDIASGSFSELTPAEREVARLTQVGLSNQAIARARSVSVRTVYNQLVTIYRKLDITSRSELAARVQLADENAAEPPA